MSRDINLRNTFDNDAELYHAMRPLYPEKLFNILIDKTGITKDSRLLEIGPGTGQATKTLAEKGYHITAIELGENLFKVAKDFLKEFPNVELIQGDYEDYEFSPNSFDVVYAATAFHWLTPTAQFTKTHTLLKERGHLAIIEAIHVSDEKGDKFFEASQRVYEKYAVGTYSKPTLPRITDLKPFEVDKNLFKMIHFEKISTQIKYSAKEYVQLLSTYSDVIARPPKNRQLFLNAIQGLIEEKFGDTLTKHYAMTLSVAGRNS